MTTIQINSKTENKTVIEECKFYIHTSRKNVIYIKKIEDNFIKLIDCGYVGNLGYLGQSNKEMFGNSRRVRNKLIESYYIPFHGEIIIKSE